MHAKSFLPRQVRQAHRPIGQIDIFFDAPCCTANFRLHVLNVHIETALLELVHNRLTFSVFTACTRFLDKAVVYMTAPNGMCGWLLHSKTFLIRFVHLSEAV